MEFHSLEEIFAAIERTRAKVVRTVESLNDDHANFRHAEDKWTIANIVEHLAKTENSLVRLVEKLLAKAESDNLPAPERFASPVSFTEIVKQFAGNKLTAPDYLQPEGAATIKESLAALEKSRAALAALRPRLEKVDLSSAEFPHPFFGNLDLYHWIAFIGLHELRHLRQVGDILQTLKSETSGAASD